MDPFSANNVGLSAVVPKGIFKDVVVGILTTWSTAGVILILKPGFDEIVSSSKCNFSLNSA